MASKVILIGTVSSEPGITYGIDGEEAIFALKTNFSKKPISRDEEVQWHRVVLMGRFIELCKKIRMQDIVYVEGVLSTAYSDSEPEGVEVVFNSEVLATDVRILSKSMPLPPGQNLAAVLIDRIRRSR